jgi:hypothetical protein
MIGDVRSERSGCCNHSGNPLIREADVGKKDLCVLYLTKLVNNLKIIKSVPTIS